MKITLGRKHCREDGHKFVARYDKILDMKKYEGWKIRGVDVEQLKDEIYLFDICIHCGKKIKRDE
jgi:hypothetical protein